VCALSAPARLAPIGVRSTSIRAEGNKSGPRFLAARLNRRGISSSLAIKKNGARGTPCDRLVILGLHELRRPPEEMDFDRHERHKSRPAVCLKKTRFAQDAICPGGAHVEHGCPHKHSGIQPPPRQVFTGGRRPRRPAVVVWLPLPPSSPREHPQPRSGQARYQHHDDEYGHGHTLDTNQQPWSGACPGVSRPLDADQRSVQGHLGSGHHGRADHQRIAAVQ
jgi:hypothetical protein